MKKILLIIIPLIMLTGCYDNVELNNISIISGIGIDYKDDNYYIYYEIYNDNKSDNVGDLLSYTVEGYGNSISKAFTDANYKTGKKPFFAHLKVIVISENINGLILKNITDYLFRNTDIRDEFKLVVTDNNPLDVLNNNSKRHPVVSDLINTLLEQEKYNNEVSTNETFKSIINKLLSKETDIILNSITIIDDDISLSDSYIYNDYYLVNKISKEETVLYNLLTKKIINAQFSNYYNNNIFSISIINTKKKIDIKDGTIKIELDLKGKVLENNPLFDLRITNTYKRINKDFSKIIKNKINDFIIKLQNNNSDIIGFNNMYYKKYNKNNYNTWKYYDIDINCKLDIIKQGYIFGGNNE